MAAATLKPPVAETTTNAPPPSKLGKPYGDVVISLENCLLPEERLQATPSSLDGLDAETEMDLRILGCELIQTAGILLDLPQVAMATGQVLFQRFYYSKSFVRHAMEVTAMGCVCLASKVEESPRRIRDIISVFNHIKQMSAQKPLEPVLLDQNYINLKNQVIKAERRVLKELGFCVHVKHPHKIIVVYLQMLGSEKNRKLIQLCWNYMNDSLRTDVFVRYSPETIACACIYLSSRKLNIALPKKPAWFELFGCTEEQLKDICIRILKLYKRPKPDADQLEKVVAQLRDAYQESRVKQKLQVEGSDHLANKQQFANSPATVAGVVVAGIATTTADGKTSSGAISSTNSPAAVKDEKNHVSSRRSRTRSRSRSHDKRKSRHHRKKRSRSTSRTRSRSRSHEKRRDKDRDRRKRDSRDRDRDYKHRKDRERSRERERDRRSRKDRSLSRDRRR